MSHSFTSKETRPYRYYVCQNAQSRGWDACPSPSVPAGEIERFVVDEIKCIGRDPGVIKETLAQARVQLEEQIERLRAERNGLWQRLRSDHADSTNSGTNVIPASINEMPRFRHGMPNAGYRRHRKLANADSGMDVCGEIAVIG